MGVGVVGLVRGWDSAIFGRRVRHAGSQKYQISSYARETGGSVGMERLQYSFGCHLVELIKSD